MQPRNIFKAMADPTRQRTLKLLQGRELSVSELVEVLAQPQSTVSRHLKVLREAGLVRDRHQGTTTLYSVLPAENGRNGPLGELSESLLAWAGRQDLPGPLAKRLRAVLDRRREMSERFFDRVGQRWDHLREESFGASFHVEAFLPLLPGHWVVADVGTGTGYLLPVLSRHFRRVIAVEPVDRMMETARHRIEPLGLENVDLRKGDLAQLPIKDESVDLAVAVLVLHHVPSPREALGELHRILRAGGRVLIVEQDAHDNDEFHARMQDRWWGFERNELSGWLRSAGFAEVSVTEMTPAERRPDVPEIFVVTGMRGNKGALASS
jgi:ArsR family transcriptional regulator